MTPWRKYRDLLDDYCYGQWVLCGGEDLHPVVKRAQVMLRSKMQERRAMAYAAKLLEKAFERPSSGQAVEA